MTGSFPIALTGRGLALAVEALLHLRPAGDAGCPYRFYRESSRGGSEQRRPHDVASLQVSRQECGSEDIAGSRGVDLAGGKGRYLLPAIV
jgi:hypothetical protein